MIRGRRGARVLAPVLLFLIGASAIPISASAAGAADAPDACALAQADVDARRVEQAFDAYTGSAADCDGAKEAIEKLDAARVETNKALHRATKQLELAAATEDTDIKEAHRQLARLAFVQALANDSASKEALEGLAALDAGPGKDPYRAARILVARGYDKEAREIALGQLKEGKDIPDGSEYDDLRKIVDPAGKNPQDKVKSFAEGILEYLKWLLGAVIVVGIVGILLFAILNRTWFDRIRRKDPDDAKPPRGFFRPRLNVVADDEAKSKVLAERVRTAIRKLDTANGTRQIRLASVPEKDLDLTSLGDIDARVKPLLVALKLAGHRDTVTVAITTGTDDDAHTRVGVEASAPKTPREVENFVRPATGGKLTPGLVGSATAWTLFTAESMRARLRIGPPRAEIYGTKSAKSYGAYLGALESLQTGTLDETRSLFIEAVQADPTFHRATLNLAVIETMDEDPLVVDIGIQRLRSLLA